MAACLAGGLSLPALGDAPRRVLSMNLCTDQLAMLVAAPGQLISVSHLAHDPRGSAMVDAAAAYPANHGLAEEIVLMQPDLVLAGRFTATATTRLLQRLGKPVEIFEPENDLQGIRDNLRRMGRLLGREAVAEAIVARFDTDLAALRSAPVRPGRAVLYAANGYSSGDNTLAGAILRAAGLSNIAAELGLTYGGTLQLEQLLLSDPDLVILGRKLPGASRSEEVLDHPALSALIARQPSEVMSDSDWVCGTPHVLRAIAALRVATVAEGRRP